MNPQLRRHLERFDDDEQHSVEHDEWNHDDDEKDAAVLLASSSSSRDDGTHDDPQEEEEAPPPPVVSWRRRLCLSAGTTRRSVVVARTAIIIIVIITGGIVLSRNDDAYAAYTTVVAALLVAMMTTCVMMAPVWACVVLRRRRRVVEEEEHGGGMSSCARGKRWIASTIPMKDDDDDDDESASTTASSSSSMRCRINALLGSIGAPPLSGDDVADDAVSSSSPRHDHHDEDYARAVLDLVTSHVTWIVAVTETVDTTLRTATALDLGRSHRTHNSIGGGDVVVDRLEMKRRRRPPLYRLRRRVWDLLERQRRALESLLLVIPVDSPYDDGACETPLDEPASSSSSSSSPPPRHVLTLTELRSSCVATGNVLSRVTHHSLLLSIHDDTTTTTTTQSRLMVQQKMRQVTKRAHEARAYLQSWESPALPNTATDGRTRDDDDEFLRDLDVIQERMGTLQVAVQCLRESHHTPPTQFAPRDDDVDNDDEQKKTRWDSFRRVLVNLEEHVKRMDRDYHDDALQHSADEDDIDRQPSPRTVTVDTAPERDEYVSTTSEQQQQPQHGIAVPADRLRDHVDEAHATLVFAGRGTRVSARPTTRTTTPRPRRFSNDGTAVPRRRPDPVVSERNVLEELRRHLQTMPRSQEVEINADEDQTVRAEKEEESSSSSSSLPPARTRERVEASETRREKEREHDGSIPRPPVSVNVMVVDELTAAVRLIDAAADEYTTFE